MITGELQSEDMILSVRDELFQICPKNKYRLIDPHLTILPPFELSEKLVTDIHDIIEAYSNSDFSMSIEGVGVYPNLSNPRVVLLDVTPSEDIRELRSELVEFLRDQNVEFRYDPTPFHITLFKCDNGYTLAEDRKQLLQNRVASNRESWANSLSNVYLEEVI